ncbi:MAG: DUF3515 domain-containing protein [Nocardioidaceae bacterium]
MTKGRRRPSPRRLGVVACSLLLLAAAGCSDTLSVDAPRLSGADADACRALVEALPGHVADQPARAVEAGSGYAAAWGDPAIVLRCGVPRPKGFNAYSGCEDTNGVGWYIPESQRTGDVVAITMTTIGRAQNVEVRIPAAYVPPANTMVDIAPALKRTIRETRPCV